MLLNSLGLVSALADALRRVSKEGYKSSNKKYNLVIQVVMLESCIKVIEY